ncbi:uncharacterized protein LOC130783346 [Actinidia eriantha]|uniref:uncharacterized protein LOC130783346 n=1 Tax=Actinidia eriantha TaxID=165200 RepID=UPI00258F94DF|nr:uncharacterized protein LOC130783346 [Actinidia eriantha]
MVELQSCGSLGNASALCAIEQEVRGERVNIVAEILAELQREKQRNAELMERISLLEAQIREREKKSLIPNGQGSCPTARERSCKKFKRQKTESSCQTIEVANIKTSEMKYDSQCIPPRETNMENPLVSWATMKDIQFLHYEKSKDDNYIANCGTDDSDNDDDDDDEHSDENNSDIDLKYSENGEKVKGNTKLKEHLSVEVFDKRIHLPCLESSSDGHVEPI